MSRLPGLSWQQVVAALKRTGFVLDRQKGSHMVYYHAETNQTVVVPRHRIIKAGTLREILREANLSREEFSRLLR